MSIATHIKTNFIIAFAFSFTTACTPATIASSQMPNTVEKIMPSNPNFVLKSVTLLAREERNTPLGIPSQAHRDIGFASVFLRLENPKIENTTLKIQSIVISNISDGKKQNFSHPSHKIYLKPLENSEIVFHLANKNGYLGKDKVKAIVTYQIEGQINRLESQPVAVNGS